MGYNLFFSVPMAPKKSAAKGKAGGAAGAEVEVHGWKSSKCTDSHLLNLVESHLLQPQNMIHWRRSGGKFFPHEGGNESVVFLPHVLRGLGFPVSDFFTWPPSLLGASSATLDP